MRNQRPLSPTMIDCLLESLPLDITVIDRDDKVIAWTSKDRQLFKIKDEVMGTNIRDCHSVRSMGVLENLLSEMKEGRLDSTRSVKDIERNGKMKRFMTQYIALRDDDGNYLGCMEVDMDLSDIPAPDAKGSPY
ncbi:MAG TPA: PAS domain-containing protein [Methanomassiliicoccales archaeon]|nr:PAS domain-containing protein [Methanomassiliicoccales archaeon]